MSLPSSGNHSSLRDPFYRIYVVMCALAMVRLWILPMHNSFWLDETLVVWTIRNGFASIVSNAFISLQSIAFCMIEWPFAQVSTSEVSLRLPSLSAACATVYLLYRLGTRIQDRELGLILASLYIAAPAVAVEVPNARPYAVTLLFHTAALYWLLVWLRSTKAKDGLVWIICATAAVYGHLLFVVAIPLEILFVVWSILSRRTQVALRTLLALSLLGLVLLLAALPQALSVLHQGRLLSYSAEPSWPDLLAALLPIHIVAAVLLVGILEAISGTFPRWSAGESGKQAATLAAIVLLVPTLAFFLLSSLTEMRAFEPRYLLPTLPGAIVLWGWLIRGLPAAFRRMVSVAVLAQAIILTGGSSLVPDYREEDWRAAVHSLPSAGALFVYPGLVETRRLDWLQDSRRWAYFTAPVSSYRGGLSQTTTFVLPFQTNQDDQTYVESLLPAVECSHDRVAVLARGSFGGPAWVDWFTDRLSRANYQAERMSTFGTVQLLVLRAGDDNRMSACRQ